MDEQLKNIRILSLYSRLKDGQIIRKNEEAQNFNVSPKTIQRDIDDLRSFFASRYSLETVVYDRKAGGYRLDSDEGKLTNSEILAVCKILLESRSLVRSEMMPILDKLIAFCVPENNKKDVTELICNERFHYIEPHHGKAFLDTLWEIGQAIKKQQVIEIEYQKLKNQETVIREIEPVGIMFSEYYFYLTAFIRNFKKEDSFDNANTLYPTIYRIDRIQKFRITDSHFQVQYQNRFEEGEFRKRVQFMFGGTLQQVKFRYTGPSIESVLDRLPTAEAIQQADGTWIVTAEVFGKGIDMWLRSQGTNIQLI